MRQGEPVEKELDALERQLFDPELKLYCGDVLIEYRPGNLKYEPLRRLQQDLRLPPSLNTVGNADSLHRLVLSTFGRIR
jgi:hypothetical protein